MQGQVQVSVEGVTVLCRRCPCACRCGPRSGRRSVWARHRSRSCARIPLRSHQQRGCTSVVVRVHNGTSEAMLRRHVAWAAELASASAVGGPSAARLWVLCDETYGGDSVRRRLHELSCDAGLRHGQLTCFTYTESDMMATFGILTELRAALPDTQRVRDCFTLPCMKSLAWGYHVEAILLWWVHVDGQFGGPEYVWFIEDDAAYSGNIAGFICAYLGDHSDLLAHNIQPVEAEWVWCNAASPAFLKLVDLGERLRCVEHVQRLSSHMLRALHQYCLQGVSAWSEMSVPTLCQTAHLQLGRLRSEHIGAIFVYHGRVPVRSWERICVEPATRNRWWHALKW